VDHIFTILNNVGIGKKGDGVGPMENTKKVAIVIGVNQKSYVNIVIGFGGIAFALVNVVQNVTNI